MRKPSCFRQFFNAVLLLLGLALIAGAVMYAVAARQCLELKPSGDKLFDRFAQAVRARQGLKLYGGLQGDGVLVPASTVVAWEGEFKEEPHYWQLRYWLGMAEYAAQQAAQPAKAKQPSQQDVKTPQPAAAGSPAPAAGEQEPPALQRQPVVEAEVLPKALLDPLQQAVANGSADDYVYLLLYEAELARMDPAATVEQRQPLLALLDQAIDFGSGLSWGYYLRALHRLDVLKGESVDWRAVRADLDLGNTAQLNGYPLAFPQSYVEEQLASRGQAAGSQVLCGAVLEQGAQIETHLTLSRTLAHATMICIKHCVEANDQELAGALLRCLCRIATAEEAPPQERIDAAGLLRVIAYYLGTRIDHPATWQQREDTFEAIRWMDSASWMGRVALDDIERTRSSRLAFYNWLDNTMAKPETGGGDAQASAFPAAPCYVRYKLAYELRCAERGVAFERFNRLLVSLSRFDFQTLSLPFDLSPVNQPQRLPRRTPATVAPTQPQ